MRPLRILYLVFLSIPLFVTAASPIEGRWRLDPARSSALDGWTAWDLVIAVADNRVSLQHDMQWRSTKVTATNVFDVSRGTEVKDFFRVEQRHMALYPAKGSSTSVRASWLDQNRTLRVEADTPIEISQGTASMRITSEYRLLEGDSALLLIELHSSRPRPLVYRFNKVTAEK
jgi:hypothetical protein